MADYNKLAELLKQNKFRGKTNAEASAILQVEDVVVAVDHVTALQLYLAVDDDEAELLSLRGQARLAEIYSLGEIELGDSRIKRVLFVLFDNTTKTQVALLELMTSTISMATDSGLGPRRTRESDVFKARAL